MSDQTRLRILDSARRVVLEKGVMRLTLNEVIEKANISKGGLLYHYSSKDELIKGMLEHAFESFEASLTKYLEKDSGPGAWLRAYIYSTFPELLDNQKDSSLTASAILATASLNPSLLEPYSKLLLKWNEALKNCGIPLDKAQTIRMASDGLWLQEALGLKPLADQEKLNFIKSLISQTQS